MADQTPNLPPKPSRSPASRALGKVIWALMLVLLVAFLGAASVLLDLPPIVTLIAAMLLLTPLAIYGYRKDRKGGQSMRSRTLLVIGSSIIVVLTILVAALCQGMNDPYPQVAIVAAFLLLALVVIYGIVRLRRQGQTRQEATRSLAFIILRWTGITCACIAIVLLVICWPMGILLGLLGAFLIVVTVDGPARMKPQRAAMVLSYLRQAVGLNLPLPAMLMAVARNEHGLIRTRLNSVADQLNSGQDISTSLRLGLPELTKRQAALIAAAERSGRLAQTLDRLDRQARLVSPGKYMDRGVIVVYPLLMLIVLAVMMMGIMLFIIPRFEKIFDDFGTELPHSTLLLINISRWMAGTLYPSQVVPGVVWVLALVLAAVVVRIGFRRGAGSGPLGYLLWMMPGFKQLARDGGMGDVCHVLEEATIAGVTPPAALAAAAQLPINVVLRRRVRRWGEAVAHGATLPQGAHAANMPQFLVGMLVAGESAAHLPAALAMVGRFYDYRAARHVTMAQAVLLPMVILCLGLLVGSVDVSLFMPLVKLISSMATTPGASP